MLQMATPVGSTPTSLTGAKKPCPICLKIEGEHLHQNTIRFVKSDVIKNVADPEGKSKKERRERKEEALNEFLKNINALLNEGYGLLCIHTSEPHLLGFFDQAVDQRLLGLIPDNSFFDDNFERTYYQDKYHVVFRVLQRKRPISTFSFNTKVSLDTGLITPSHGQMRHFLKHKMDDPPEKEPNVQYRFVRDQEVEVTVVDKNGEQKEIVFQESTTVQAKQIFDECATPEDLAQYCFDKVLVHNYISAFSKLQKGGSVFLGVKERKTEVKKWTEDNTKSELHERLRNTLSELGGGLKLYRDNNDLLHICSESQVPTDKDETGLFECEGVVPTGTEERQARFKSAFLRQAEKRLCWFPSPSKPSAAKNVRVDFLAVEAGKKPNKDGLVVIRIYIPKFQGVCFLQPSGPEAYQFQNQTENGPGEIVLVDIKTWLSKNKEEA